MDLGLDARVFVIGGGSAGLGHAVATVLVAEGAQVVLCGRDEARLAAAVAACGSDRAVGVVADLAAPDSAQLLVESALNRFGRLDGALVNSGGPPVGSPGEVTDQDWIDGFGGAVLGPVRLARVCAEHLHGPDGSGGALCFVLSTSVRSPLPNLAISNALRPGLAMHVKDLADHYGPPPRSVRVTGVLPGPFATERFRDAHPDPAERERYVSRVPLRRVGEPAELARAAVFLLSPAASYITGTVLAVDGGVTRSP